MCDPAFWSQKLQERSISHTCPSPLPGPTFSLTIVQSLSLAISYQFTAETNCLELYFHNFLKWHVSFLHRDLHYLMWHVMEHSYRCLPYLSSFFALELNRFCNQKPPNTKTHWWHWSWMLLPYPSLRVKNKGKYYHYFRAYMLIYGNINFFFLGTVELFFHRGCLRQNFVT